MRKILGVKGAVLLTLSAGCAAATLTASLADVQSAQASGGEKCVASVVRAGSPDAAKNAVAFAPPALETRYLIGSDYYYQVASVDGMTVTTVNPANQTYTWLAGMIYAPNQMDKAAVEAIWPLEIGKRVTFLERSGKDAWCHTVDILRAESINVPAGSFETIVLEEQIKSVEPTQGNLDVRRTYWYAPAAHWTIKKEIKQIAGPPFASEPYVLNQIVTAASRPPTVNPGWAKIDCGDAHIDLPFTQPHDCYRAPNTGGSCAESYGTAGTDNTVQFEIYLTLGGGTCGIYFSGDNIQNFAQQATATSRNGLDFSTLKRFGATEVVSFTGRGRQGPLSCFAFAMIGHRIGAVRAREDALYRYAMHGHVCKTDGTTLTDADIEPLARAIGVD